MDCKFIRSSSLGRRSSGIGFMHNLMKRVHKNIHKAQSPPVTFPNRLVSTGDFKLWDQSDKNLSMISLSF